MPTKEPDIHPSAYWAALKRRGFAATDKNWIIACPLSGMKLDTTRSPRQTYRGKLAWLIRQDKKWAKRIKEHREKQ